MRPIVPRTDVVSFLFKGDSRAERYLGDLEWIGNGISCMTEAELGQRVLLSRWSSKRTNG